MFGLGSWAFFSEIARACVRPDMDFRASDLTNGSFDLSSVLGSVGGETGDIGYQPLEDLLHTVG